VVTLEVEKRCGCFTRAKLDGSYKFDSKEKASKKAAELLEVMNQSFLRQA